MMHDYCRRRATMPGAIILFVHNSVIERVILAKVSEGLIVEYEVVDKRGRSVAESLKELEASNS